MKTKRWIGDGGIKTTVNPRIMPHYAGVLIVEPVTLQLKSHKMWMKSESLPLYTGGTDCTPGRALLLFQMRDLLRVSVT